jgi:hypothetical protein
LPAGGECGPGCHVPHLVSDCADTPEGAEATGASIEVVVAEVRGPIGGVPTFERQQFLGEKIQRRILTRV